MFTTCPKCSLKLVVTAADLRVAQGFVRCGRCSNVFNALAGLSDEQQAVLAREQAVAEVDRPTAAQARPPASAPRESLPSATREPLPSPPGESHAPAASDEDPVSDEALEFDASATDVSEVFVESGDDDPTGTFESIVLGGEDAPPEEPELHELELDLEALVSAAGPRKTASGSSEPARDPSETSLESSEASPESIGAARTRASEHAATSETSSIPKIATGKDNAALHPDDAAAARASERDDAAASTDAVAHIDGAAHTDAAVHATGAAHADAAARATGAGHTDGAAHADAAAHATGTARTEAVHAGTTAAQASFAANDLAAAIGRGGRDAPEDASPTRERFLWIGSAALALILILQIAHHERARLATIAWLRTPLTAVYAALGMPLVPHWNVGAYEVRQLGAVAGPRNPGTLTVRASVKNTASAAQPLPLLRVTMQDRFGNRVAARDVPPSAYLPAASASRTDLAAGQSVDAEIAFVDPGPDAVGFEIDACLKLASGRIACANGANDRR